MSSKNRIPETKPVFWFGDATTDKIMYDLILKTGADVLTVFAGKDAVTPRLTFGFTDTNDPDQIRKVILQIASR